MRDQADEEIDVLEQRVEELERLYFGAEGAVQDGDVATPAWDALSTLEEQVTSMEELLNPDSVTSLAVGSECLAYSIADGKWLEAVIEAKPSGRGGVETSHPRTYSIRFTGTGQKRSVVSDQLRAATVDLHAVVSAEEAVLKISRERLPVSDDFVAGVAFPLALPLSSSAQRAIVLDAEAELSLGAECLGTLFASPHDLAATAVDSDAIADMPNHVGRLAAAEAALAVTARRAGILDADTKALTSRYSDVVGSLNQKMIEWDDALSRIGERGSVKGNP